MRPVRKVTAEEENFRLETFNKDAQRQCDMVKRDPVEPEPVGTIVLMAFRVTGYDPDCDGSLMARLEHIRKDGECSGWEPTHIGLLPDYDLVVTPEEWAAMFPATTGKGKS